MSSGTHGHGHPEAPRTRDEEQDFVVERSGFHGEAGGQANRRTASGRMLAQRGTLGDCAPWLAGWLAGWLVFDKPRRPSPLLREQEPTPIPLRIDHANHQYCTTGFQINPNCKSQIVEFPGPAPASESPKIHFYRFLTAFDVSSLSRHTCPTNTGVKTLVVVVLRWFWWVPPG
ncbi:hypothetical protein PV04_10117 [Phialophora macrospora]|uniref:Uncharacterized protein n=1 Tax=Phialophora macrospora TaxID=1851006 RepID=A0A0D2F8J6_9EURO|nr:hypothetical protein PV04_10117 [Phialophora macrospora]